MTTRGSESRPAWRIVREPVLIVMPPGPEDLHGAAPTSENPASRRLFVCAECVYAVLFAGQPRARCVCPAGASEGRMVFTGRPACDDARPRSSDDRPPVDAAPGTEAPQENGAARKQRAR